MRAGAHSKATLLVPSYPMLFLVSLFFFLSSVGIVSHYCPDRVFTLISISAVLKVSETLTFKCAAIMARALHSSSVEMAS